MLDLELQSLWRELEAQGLPVGRCNRAQELLAVTVYITALRARVYLVGSAFTKSKTMAYSGGRSPLRTFWTLGRISAFL